MPQGNSGNGTRDAKTAGQDQKRVIDFSEARAQRLDEKRRKTERLFFKQLLSVYSVAGDSSMLPIELVDISESGMAFQVPYDTSGKTKPWPTQSDNVPIRLYFSQDTYLEVHVKIVNSRPAIDREAAYHRYGCEIDTQTASYAAYQQFVRFLELYAEHAHKDLGDATVFYL